MKKIDVNNPNWAYSDCNFLDMGDLYYQRCFVISLIKKYLNVTHEEAVKQFNNCLIDVSKLDREKTKELHAELKKINVFVFCRQEPPK